MTPDSPASLRKSHWKLTGFGPLSGMSRTGSDNRDARHGAYDPVVKDGLPQPDQVKDKTTPHQAAQHGADVRAEALPGTEPVLPEGLTRPRRAPLNAKTGRHETD